MSSSFSGTKRTVCDIVEFIMEASERGVTTHVIELS